MGQSQTSASAKSQCQSFLSRDAVGTIGGKILLVPNPGTVETVNHAVNAYGFLIGRNERVSAFEFANRIEKAYNCNDCPQNAAVVAALRRLI